MGSTGLPNLDPFHDIDPMVTDDEVNGLPMIESTPIAPEYETPHDPDWHHGEDLDVNEDELI